MLPILSSLVDASPFGVAAFVVAAFLMRDRLAVLFLSVAVSCIRDSARRKTALQALEVLRQRRPK